MAAKKSKSQEQLREIGFGSRNFSDSGRLIRKDGKFNVDIRGAGIKGFSGYHWVINMSWGGFFLFVLAAYIIINLVFAALYFVAGPQNLTEYNLDNSTWEHFVHCFYFSTQTLTTVGFGRISPTSDLTSFIAAFEAMIGLLAFALATGILYGRFSKAKAKILFSEKALIAPYRGGRGLKIRFANLRKNNIIDVSARIMYSFLQEESGEVKRRYRQLPLEIDFINLFPLPWTLVHAVDEESPLFGKGVLHLSREDAEFIVIVKGYDDTFNQYVHQVYSYGYDEVVFDVDFLPVFQPKAGTTEVMLDQISAYRKV